MYVCLCRGITDQQIKAAAESGARSLGDVCSSLGVASQCGRCSEHAMEILREVRGDDARRTLNQGRSKQQGFLGTL